MALTKPSEDFPAWYQEVVKGAEMAEPGLVRGTMIIRPYGYAIWEAIQSGLDRRIKKTGHSNLYFPMFIPMKLIDKEAEHVEGFAPQIAVVTHAGGAALEEPIAVRPTSETIIWATYARWIQSYRDLPLLYNQWANVVRWELRTRLFLRTTEFLWQEGHTAHETAEEAIKEALMILSDVYQETVEKDFAMPVLTGRKSASERFAGAVETYTIEALMRDGKALQAGTSHYLGQNFAKAYDVEFQGRDGKQAHPYATSWGVTTRLIGAIIMAHGDEKGLRLPPRVAPHQVVIVPIHRSDDERASVLEGAHRVASMLGETRVRIDDREEHRPGYKFNEWELKGVPIRIELGPRDLTADQVVVSRRDTGEKSSMAMSELAKAIPALLDEIQATLYAQALEFRAAMTHAPDDYSALRDQMLGEGGFAVGGWCGGSACEEKVKEETKATIRLLEMEPGPHDQTSCLVCGQAATEKATWAQSY